MSKGRWNDSIPMNEDAREQTRSDQAKASNRQSRERILTSGGEDVTEAVVSVLDALHSSLDWGSQFLGDTDVEDATHLMKLLGFKCWEYWWTENKERGPCLLLIGHDGDHHGAEPQE